MTKRGCFAVVVGPDGAGKTTFAEELLALYDGSARYFHFRPPISGRLLDHVPRSEPMPKSTARVSRPMGWVRLLAAIPRFWIGYLSSVQPRLRDGSLVLGDRWAYGYLVQPLSLRFRGPAVLARLAIGLMPQPRIVFNLAAPADVIHSRKKELSEAAIRTELKQWKAIPARVVTLDAMMTPQALAREAKRLIGR